VYVDADDDDDDDDVVVVALFPSPGRSFDAVDPSSCEAIHSANAGEMFASNFFEPVVAALFLFDRTGAAAASTSRPNLPRFTLPHTDEGECLVDKGRI